ncbi:MAG: protein O-mannosyl-transferase family, partial [Endomicrobiia bacterium]
MITQITLFFNIFLIYLYTLFPTVAAYRDSGEFCSVGKILGIAHPPGYPFYTLLINIFGRIFPLGNYAYRINIFSAITSSCVAVGFYKLYIFLNEKIYKENRPKIIYRIVGYLSSLIFAFGYLQWYLSLVSEMYTLNTLFAFILVYLCILYFLKEKRFVYLSCFVFGLGITNRLDLIFFSPLIILVFFDYIKYCKKKFKTFLTSLFIFLLGFSCYLYLPIRSAQDPFIDWNNPQKINSLWASLIRKTHGSTLDLISKGYKKAENFFEGLKLYFYYIYKNFTAIGIMFVILGFVNIYKFNFDIFLSLFLSWILSCVYFIYKANMPPNPHSFAILEAHFLLPNIIVFVWFIFGV